MDRRSFDGLCEAGLGSRGLASGHSIEYVCTCLGIIITSTSDGFRISDILLYFYLMLVCAVAVLSRLAAHFNLFVINDLFKFPSLLS